MASRAWRADVVTLYAEVIGDPIMQSKSPAIHRFWLEKLGIDADYRATLVRPDELTDYFAQRREDADWRGCNVTMPHKVAAATIVDRQAEAVSLLSACNTVVPVSGFLEGFNTDVAGVAEPLRIAQPADYPNHVATYVQIIGAGGAARAAILGARNAGLGDFEFYNRSLQGAKKMAELCGLPEWFGNDLGAIGPIRNDDDAGPEHQRYSMVVINATSMGMNGENPVPIDLSRYYADTVVFDMVYAPLETPLLRQARDCGLKVIDGLQMLVGQAAAAFELFFGAQAPREHDPELRALLTA